MPAVTKGEVLELLTDKTTGENCSFNQAFKRFRKLCIQRGFTSGLTYCAFQGRLSRAKNKFNSPKAKKSKSVMLQIKDEIFYASDENLTSTVPLSPEPESTDVNPSSELPVDAEVPLDNTLEKLDSLEHIATNSTRQSRSSSPQKCDIGKKKKAEKCNKVMESGRRNKRLRTLPKKFSDSIIEISSIYTAESSDSSLLLEKSEVSDNDLIHVHNAEKNLEDMDIEIDCSSSECLKIKESCEGAKTLIHLSQSHDDSSMKNSSHDHFYCKKQSENLKNLTGEKTGFYDNIDTEPNVDELICGKVLDSDNFSQCSVCITNFPLNKDLISMKELNSSGVSPLDMVKTLASESMMQEEFLVQNTTDQLICRTCCAYLNEAYSSHILAQTKLGRFIKQINPASSFNRLQLNHNNADENVSNKEIQTGVKTKVPNTPKNVGTKNFLNFLRSILKKPGGKEKLLAYVKSLITREITDYCNYKNGTLSKSFCDDSVHKFGWKKLQDEFETHMPMLTGIIKAASFGKCEMHSIKKCSDAGSDTSQLQEDLLRKTVALGNIMANIVYLNNKKLSLIQQANSIMMFYAGSTNWMLNVLHHLGLCIPAKELKAFVDVRRQTQDNRMLLWRKRIMKPKKFMRIFKYPCGQVSAKDISSEDGVPRSTETAPKDCRIVYLRGIKTCVSIRPSCDDVVDSDEECEDELKLPKMLEDKYNGESHILSTANLPSDKEKLDNCQNAMNKVLQSFGGLDKMQNLFKHYPSLSQNIEIDVKRVSDKSSNVQGDPELVDPIDKAVIVENNDPTNVAKNIHEVPQMVENGEVMYLVMDDEQSAENILLDLQQAGFTAI